MPMISEGGDKKFSHELRLGDLLRLSVRVFRTRASRTVLTILGMSFGIGVVLFLVSLGYGLQYLLIGRMITSNDSLKTVDAYYPPDAGIIIRPEDIEKITSFPEVREAVPIAEFPGEIKRGDLSGLAVFRIVSPDYFRLSGDFPDLGMPLIKSDPSGVVLSSSALKILDIPEDGDVLGKEIEGIVFYQSQNGIDIDLIKIEKPLKIKGVITDESRFPIAIISPSNISAPPPYFQNVLIKTGDIKDIEPLRDKLINIGFIISAKIDLVNQASKIMAGITVVLGIFGVTALIVAAIGMFNTMMIGFLERIYEVGIMKAIGATDGSIRNLFFMESILIGVAGGLGGIFLGLGAGVLFNWGLNALSKSLGGNEITLFITPLWFSAFILSLSILIGFLAGFFPARRAIALSPKQAFMQK